MIVDALLHALDSVKWFGLRKLYWIVKHWAVEVVEVLIDRGFLYPAYQQSLVKRSVSRKLVDFYNGDDGHQTNRTQFFLGFGLIHYAFVRNLRPVNILVIGSRKGFIPATIALACKDNGRGHVDFVDAGFDQDQPARNWSGIGFWKKEDPARHFAKIGIGDHITTHVMQSEEFSAKFPKKRYQYIYIDGDHSYEGVKSDWQLFWPKLDRAGFMVFHDVVATGSMGMGKFGVEKLWKQISKKHAIIFPFPKSSGLGIVQKR